LTNGQVNALLTKIFFARSESSGYSPEIVDEDYQKIKIQLKALNLIDLTADGRLLKWSLAPRGESMMYEAGYVRSTLKAKQHPLG
jgi:hypothetical protein